MNTIKTTIGNFINVTSEARELDKNIMDNLSQYEHEDLNGIDLYLSDDEFSGFGIVRKTMELVNVFSLKKGRGKDLLKSAISLGANNLDCFDGYLVDFYKSQGFTTDRVEPNWTQGEPSVHYMVLNK